MRIITPTDLSYLDKMVECQIEMAFETEELKLDPLLVLEGITTVINNPQKGLYYLAVGEQNNLLGMLLTMPEWSDWRCREIVWIHSVYVYNKHRGTKVFKQMYEHIKNLVLQNDKYAGIRLYVDKSNLNAIEVYSKLGMNDNHYRLFEFLK